MIKSQMWYFVTIMENIVTIVKYKMQLHIAKLQIWDIELTVRYSQNNKKRWQI